MNHYLLKKLARSTRWQLLYNRAKDVGTIKLFYNDIDFGKHQIWMLYYLELYSSLYSDISMGEEYINEDVIKDDIRCEAYILYRSKKRKEDKIKNKSTEEKNQTKDSGGLPRVIFRRKNK